MAFGQNGFVSVWTAPSTSIGFDCPSLYVGGDPQPLGWYQSVDQLVLVHAKHNELCLFYLSESEWCLMLKNVWLLSYQLLENLTQLAKWVRNKRVWKVSLRHELWPVVAFKRVWVRLPNLKGATNWQGMILRLINHQTRWIQFVCDEKSTAGDHRRQASWKCVWDNNFAGILD